MNLPDKVTAEILARLSSGAAPEPRRSFALRCQAPGLPEPGLSGKWEVSMRLPLWSELGRRRQTAGPGPAVAEGVAGAREVAKQRVVLLRRLVRKPRNLPSAGRRTARKPGRS